MGSWWRPPETLTPEQAAAQQAVSEAYNKCYEHLDTCPHCSIEESRLQKKRATPVH